MRRFPQWRKTAAAIAVGAGTVAVLAGSVVAVRNLTSMDGLPNPVFTPGAVDTSKTAVVLCTPGYTTSSVRPAGTYTDSLKLQQIASYGYGDTKPQDYEEDHLVPLEIGGDPMDPRNLWPEPRYGAHPAKEKDRLENLLKSLLCHGKANLADEQRDIAANWVAAEAKYGAIR